MINKFFRPIEEKLPTWIKTEGSHSDVIISSRARLARNLKGFKYHNKLSEKDAENILKIINEIFVHNTEFSKNLFLINLNFLPVETKKFLKERFLATDYMMKGTNKEIICELNESYSILVNEEDHLRIQAFEAGFAIDKVFEEVYKISDIIESRCEYDFSEEFGYLTACPTNAGTGLRLSVMMHLPGIYYTKKNNEIFNSLNLSGFSIRGIYGEGSDPLGFIYQISNQYTLGESEKETKEKFKKTVLNIYNIEKESREMLLKSEPDFIINFIKRYLLNFESFDSIRLQDAIKFLSFIRLAVSFKFLNLYSYSDLNKLLILIQPMHLMNFYFVPLNQFTKDYENKLRALLIKKYINKDILKNV